MAEKKENRDLEMVEVRLFKDGGKYNGDVFVSVNDMNYLIKRGETVKVPRCIAEAIRNQEDQDAATAMTVTELVTEYEEKAKKA